MREAAAFVITVVRQNSPLNVGHSMLFGSLQKRDGLHAHTFGSRNSGGSLSLPDEKS